MVNVIATTILLKRAVAHMAANGGGRVLNVASAASFMPGPHMAVYHATKAYLLSLSEAVASESAKDAVFVTALCPGPTDTGFFAADGSAKTTLLNRFFPMPGPDKLATAGWKAMEKGRRVVVPGITTKLASFAPRLLPRRLITGAMRFLLKKRW
jgi:uncharacterized protein